MVSPLSHAAVSVPNARTPASSSERENLCILPPKGMVRLELRDYVQLLMVLLVVLVGHLQWCCWCFEPRHLLAAGADCADVSVGGQPRRTNDRSLGRRHPCRS